MKLRPRMTPIFKQAAEFIAMAQARKASASRTIQSDCRLPDDLERTERGREAPKAQRQLTDTQAKSDRYESGNRI